MKYISKTNVPYLHDLNGNKLLENTRAQTYKNYADMNELIEKLDAINKK